MFRRSRLIGIVVAVLILAVTVTGVALATPDPQAKPGKANLYQDFLAKFAANLGVDQDKVVSALDATKKQMLDEAVQQGRLTQEQADKIAARSIGNFGWFGDFHGKKHDRKFGFKEGGRNFKGDIATALGMTPEELQSELESGKNLQQIIADRGLTDEQFHQKMLEIKKEALARAVEEGKLTQEKADRVLEKMEQRASKLAPGSVNNQ